MKFTRRELSVEIYGEAYKISFPTVKQSQEYGKSVESADDSDATGKLLDFLEGLGLPKNVAEEMESEHLTQVIAALVPSQKK
jgi:hypothetical protein